MSIRGIITAGTEWRPAGADRVSATLPNGDLAEVWRTADGVSYTAGGSHGLVIGSSMAAECARLAHAAARPVPGAQETPWEPARDDRTAFLGGLPGLVAAVVIGTAIGILASWLIDGGTAL